MVIGISIFISFIVILLLIAIFPLKVEKKPLYIVTGISGLIVFLSVFAAYSLVWWYGIMVFAGLLLALAILFGKKMEWLKPINLIEKDMKHKPFPLEFKESGKGRSIYDDKVSQLAVTSRNKIDENVEEIQPIVHSNDEDTHDKGGATNDQSEELMNSDFADYIEMTELIQINDSNEVIEVWEQDDLLVETVEGNLETKNHDDVTSSLEVEELSDEWLNSRLDAMYGGEQSTSIGFDFENQGDQPLEFYELEDRPASLEEEYALLTGDEVEGEYIGEQDVEFEDLSQLYYHGKRGDNDGTTK
ncbi:hypothetical protein ACFOZY_05430 [Chungangia koreensis]|uniref:MFS transporter n=1 Tax=Chungangia koreensis TaxID=752657 RepID=A0ABV8X1U6_9LACT